MYCGTSIPSGILTTNTQVYTGRGTLNAVLAEAGSTVTIYDGTDNTGKIIFQITADEVSNLYSFNTHVRCEFGLYAEVSGGDVIIYYGA